MTPGEMIVELGDLAQDIAVRREHPVHLDPWKPGASVDFRDWLTDVQGAVIPYTLVRCFCRVRGTEERLDELFPVARSQGFFATPGEALGAYLRAL